MKRSDLDEAFKALANAREKLNELGKPWREQGPEMRALAMKIGVIESELTEIWDDLIWDDLKE